MNSRVPIKFINESVCKYLKVVFIPAFFSLLMLPFYSYATQVSDDIRDTVDTEYYLDKGIDQKNEGQWEKALNLWLQAWNRFQDDDPDFRIGIEFMDLVTEKQAADYYPLATKLYEWGLGANKIEKFEDYLKQEIHHIEPLINDKTFEKWKSYLDEENPQLLTELKQFWHDSNPAPNSDMNERLIEHWERLQHSKKYFTREQTTHFNTDDRGSIYLKYGEPDERVPGNIQLNHGDMNRWVNEFIEDQDADYDEHWESRGGEDSFNKWVSDQELERNIGRQIAERAIVRSRNSDYEVWVYEEVENHTRENLIFVFGESAEDNTFSMLNAPEDIIPMTAFRERTDATHNVSYNYGPLYQLTVYQNMKNIDDYFLDRFNDMENFLYMDDEAMFQTNTSNRIREKNRRRLNNMQEHAPTSASVYDQHLSSLDFNVNISRFFDDNMDPYVMFFTYTEPREIILQDHYNLLAVDEDAESDYLLRHHLSVRDKEFEEIRSNYDLPSLQLVEEEQLSKLVQPSSIFMVKQGSETINRVDFTSELFNHNREEYKQIDDNYYHLPEKLVGVGQNSIAMDTIPALSENDLEISDILLGYGSENTENQGETGSEFEIPFHIPPEPVIPYGSDIDLLFDVYNLETPEDDYTSFSIDYQVRKQESGNWFLNLFRSDDHDTETSLTLNFEISGTQTREHLVIDASNFDPGEYILELEIKDRQNENRVSRTKTFEVIDLENLAELN